MRTFLRNCCDFLLTASNVNSQIVDYIYPHSSEPTYSNYGTVGLIQMPSARMHPGGTIGFTWTHAEPYLRGSIMGHPLIGLKHRISIPMSIIFFIVIRLNLVASNPTKIKVLMQNFE